MPEAGSRDKVISKVQIFSSASIISGSVSHEPGQRLLDLLNACPAGMGAHEADFIYVNDATIAGEARQNPQQPIYVNKTNVFFVTEEESEAWGKKPGALYPYISKEVVGIKFYVPSYTLTGKIHYPRGHRPQAVLTSQLRFFPLTDAHIYSAAGRDQSQAPFVAVNKDQILYIESIL